MPKRAWTALSAALLLLILTASAAAQTEYKVVSLDVEGNRIATKSLILGVVNIQIGEPLSQTTVQESMHRLYGLGLFSDVRIEAEEVPGGVAVVVVVSELPKLSDLEFTGNKKIKSKKLKESLGLGVGGYISPYLIYQKAEKIKEMYAEKGYFRAEVDHTLKYNEDSTAASLTYNIHERSKVKVEKVIVTGNHRVEASSLIGKMRNRKRGFLKSSDFAQEKYEEDLQKVVDEYHKRGFIDAYLVSDSTQINPETNRMMIYLDVYEGPLYYFGDVAFEGTEVLSPELLASRLKFQKGKPFDSEKYDESLYEIYTTYQDVGHLHTYVEDKKTTHDDSIIDITYTISEGLPSHIRLVNIVGNTKTKEKVIRRELKVYPGQVFNRSLLIRSIREVMALNYFTNVEPTPVNLPDGDVDLEFKVEEKQTGQISAGAGYNSTDKLVGSVGVGIPNFRGNGQSLSFNIDFGSRRNSFSVSFTEPYLFGRPTLMGTDIFSQMRRWYEDYTESQRGASIRLGRRLRWPDNYFRIYASYRLERNRFDDFSDAFISSNSYNTTVRTAWGTDSTGAVADSSSTTSHIGAPYPGSILLYNEEWNTASRLSLTITRDSRNLPEFATSGSVISFSIAQTGNWLGGFWNYRKYSASVAKFIPLIGNLAFAAKVQFGAITSSDPTDQRILISDRFTPGGTAYDGIVRGYDDGVLTPDSTVTHSDTTITYYINTSTGQTDTTVNTDPEFRVRVRGNFMLVGNFELQFPVSGRSIFAIAFVDAGNSWRKWRDIRPFKDLYSGGGFGFRVVVPGIGTLGFDFAYPFEIPPNDVKQSWHTHFQIGTTFR